MSVKNVISWHSAFTCSFGTLSPGLKSYLVHQVVKWEKSTPITPWWPTLKTKNKVIFWISLRILHQISVTAKKLITCFKVIFREVCWNSKGGGFYDKLGAEVGTQNAIKSALATFIDWLGWFLVCRLNFNRTIPNIGNCSIWSA